MNRQTSIQLTPATQNQIAELQAAGFGTFTDIVRISIDRMHQEELMNGKVVTTPIKIEATRRMKYGFNYSAGQPLEIPTKPDYTGTFAQVSKAIAGDLTLKSFKSGGTYYVSAWFVKYQGAWWRVHHNSAMVPHDLDYLDDVELTIEKM